PTRRPGPSTYQSSAAESFVSRSRFSGSPGAFRYGRIASAEPLASARGWTLFPRWRRASALGSVARSWLRQGEGKKLGRENGGGCGGLRLKDRLPPTSARTPG